MLQAADGKEALSWCKRREADVLVTDVVLPGGIDGWQIAKRCREHHPELLVIYATGFSPVDARPVAGSLSCVSRIFRGKSSPRSGRCRETASPPARDARFGVRAADLPRFRRQIQRRAMTAARPKRRGADAWPPSKGFRLSPPPCWCRSLRRIGIPRQTRGFLYSTASAKTFFTRWF